jgi:hypothetical protein
MQHCAHSPGIVVEVDPAEEVWSTCTGCGRPIVRRYENIGDEDRIAGWGRWKAGVGALV